MPSTNRTEHKRRPSLPPLPPLPPIPGLDDFEIVMPEVPEARPSPWYWFGWRSNNDDVVPRSITTLQNRNASLRIENERLQREIERLKNENMNLGRDDDRNSPTIESLREQLAQLKIRSDQQAQTIQELRDEVSKPGGQDQTIEELSIQIADLSKKNDEQNQTIGRFAAQIGNLSMQNGQRNREIEELKRQLDDLKGVNAEHIEKIRNLNELLSKCEEQKRYRDASLNAVVEERDQATQEAKAATEKLQKMTEDVIALGPKLTGTIKTRLEQHFREETDILSRSTTATHTSPSDPILAEVRELGILDKKISRCEEQITEADGYKDWISSIWDDRPVEVIATGAIEFQGIDDRRLQQWDKEADWQHDSWEKHKSLLLEEFWLRAEALAKKVAEGFKEDKSWMREFVKETGPGPDGQKLSIIGQIDPDEFVDDSWVPPPGTDWKNAGRQEWWYDEDPTRKEAILKARADFEKMYPDGLGVPDDPDWKGWKDEDFCNTIPPNVDWDNTGRSSPIYDWDPPDPEDKIEKREDVTQPSPDDKE